MASRLPFTAAQLLSTLRSQKGLTEHPAGTNRQPFSTALGVVPGPWCADFVGWAFLKLGVDLRNVSPNFRWTPSFAIEAQNAGWDRVSPSAARAGDLVFCDFDGGGIDHVCTATGNATGDYVPTIDGNTAFDEAGSQSNGGAVAEKRRRLSVVAAVIRPPYAVPAAVPYRLHRILSVGSKGEDVRKVQSLVGATADGDFGKLTDAAVRGWQRRHHLTADGDFGPNSAKAAGWTFGA